MDSHKTVSTKHNLFEEKGEPKRYRTEVIPFTSLTPYRQAKPAHAVIYQRDLLRAAALTDTEKKKLSQKVDPGEENSPAAPSSCLKLEPKTFRSPVRRYYITTEPPYPPPRGRQHLGK